MKNWRVLLAIAGAILIALGAHWIHQGDLPRRDIALKTRSCRIPVTIFSPPSGIAPAGNVIILHGLSANRRIMFYLGQDFAGHGIRAYLPDLPGHGDNTDPFSFARAEDCADEIVATLIQRDALDPDKTILLGHSMGGAIAIRLADKIPLAATIAISPAPMVAPQRMPANLLVFSAQFDVWQLRDQAVALQTAAGGDRSDAEDFAQRRAFDLARLSLSTHTSMLDDRVVAHRAELWTMQALVPQADPKTLALNLDLSTYGTFGRGRLRLAGAVCGLIGLFALLPLCVVLAAKSAGHVESPDQAEHLGGIRWALLGQGMIGAMIAVLVLVKFNPLRFIHLYAGNYLASEAMIMAIVLLLFNRTAVRKGLSLPARPLIAAATLAFVVLLAFGAWFNWEITDLWLNASRWVRFAELLPFACFFFCIEQAILGPVGSGKFRAARFGLFLGLRFEIWLACLISYFVLASGQILLPILLVQFGAFSAGQALVSDALRRRIGPAAAALFGAILTAWFVAAVFPVT